MQIGVEIGKRYGVSVNSKFNEKSEHFESALRQGGKDGKSAPNRTKQAVSFIAPSQMPYQ